MIFVATEILLLQKKLMLVVLNFLLRHNSEMLRHSALAIFAGFWFFCFKTLQNTNLGEDSIILYKIGL